MSRWRNIFLLCLFTSWCFCQNKSTVDSILTEVQNHKINESIVQRALDIPYDKIVNDLNKCQFIFNTLNTAIIFENNATKKAEIKEKLSLLMYLKGNYTQSLELHLQSIKLFDKSGDFRRKANAMAAMAYEGKKRNLPTSIEQMAESIEILRKLNVPADLASAIDNYGVLFELKGELDTATKYYKEALSIKETLHDSIGIPYSLNNIAGVLFMKNYLNEGLKYINRSTEIRNKLGDYIGMAWNEYTLGEMFFLNKNNVAAKYHFQKAYNFAKKSEYPDLQERTFKYMSSLFAKEKRYDSAYIYFNRFFDIHNSLYNQQNQKQIVEMGTLYETEKKSLEIKSLNSDNKLKQKELAEKRNVQFFLFAIIGLALIAGIIILKAYRQKNVANKIISSQKIEVEYQKKLIEEKQKETVDSINYAKRIQYTLLANEELLQNNLPQHFVLFKPKDIVSGDFYWATKKNNSFYLAAGDSTGHGVPGAFMSLLNINFLNEAINEKNISAPNEILNHVRKQLIEKMYGRNDGMDAILLKAENTNNTFKIQYAAANNEPVLIRNNKAIPLPKDKMPVGKGEKTESFTLQNMGVIKGDLLFLFTDGYADQFGGPKGKKFKYKQLEDILVANNNKPLIEQKELLEKTFNEWKGNLEQVDDVLLIGIKI